MLRTNRCVICDVTIPPGRRLDRRYCGKNCREVAYRARKKAAGEPGRRRSPPGDEAVVWPAAYANIPREVLNVLARHFGQEHESLSSELAAARRRIEELERLQSQGSETALAAAISDQRKLSTELEQVKEHAAASLDKLTTQLETSQRQQRQTAETLRSLESTSEERRRELAAVAEQLTITRSDATVQKERADKSEGELADARSEIASLKQNLAEAGTVVQQLADARAEAAAQSELAERSSTELEEAQRDQSNLKQKLATAERLAEEQGRQISRLQQQVEAAEEREAELAADLELASQAHQRAVEKLAALERVPHAPQAQLASINRRLPEAQPAMSPTPWSMAPATASVPKPALDKEAALRGHVEDEVGRLTRALADTQRQRDDMRTDRDRFAQECLTLRSALEERFSEDRLDELAQRGEDMIAQAFANLGQSAQARAAAQDHRLHHWTRRALGRRVLETLLVERRPIDIERWARQSVSVLRKTAQGSASIPGGLGSWLAMHESFVISAAQGIASSVGTQLALSIPAMCLTASARLPRAESLEAVPSIAPAAPREGAVKMRRRPQTDPASTPSIPRTITLPPNAPQRPPSLPIPRSEPTDEERRGLAPAATLAWEYDPKQDWLVRWKMDELRTSNELATWQDIRGKPVTAARLVEGKTLREQAIAAAMLARWDYFRNPPPERKTPVQWVHHGFLLDPESEAALRDISSTRNVDMASEVSWLKL